MTLQTTVNAIAQSGIGKEIADILLENGVKPNTSTEIVILLALLAMVTLVMFIQIKIGNWIKVKLFNKVCKTFLQVATEADKERLGMVLGCAYFSVLTILQTVVQIAVLRMG
ncbi:MAG: hypothetical protein WBB28_01665 [Crinalium sp.]